MARPTNDAAARIDRVLGQLGAAELARLASENMRAAWDAGEGDALANELAADMRRVASSAAHLPAVDQRRYLASIDLADRAALAAAVAAPGSVALSAAVEVARSAATGWGLVAALCPPLARLAALGGAAPSVEGAACRELLGLLDSLSVVAVAHRATVGELAGLAASLAAELAGSALDRLAAAEADALDPVPATHVAVMRLATRLGASLPASLTAEPRPEDGRGEARADGDGRLASNSLVQGPLVACTDNVDTDSQ